MSDSVSSASESHKPEESVMEQEGIIENISLDDFNPTGTLAVAGMYFVLLLVLYVLLYFVEFAGRDVNIIG
jgi:hypothetical protein